MTQYGATYQIEDGELIVTNVFPVPDDWDGYRFNGYCRPTRQEIIDGGYPDPDLPVAEAMQG